MSKAKVTIIVETEHGTATTVRESSGTIPGHAGALVLPALMSAVKAAAADHLDEIPPIKAAARMLADAFGAVK